MKERTDLDPESVDTDTLIFKVIDGKVYEFETYEDQELFGDIDGYNDLTAWNETFIYLKLPLDKRYNTSI